MLCYGGQFSQPTLKGTHDDQCGVLLCYGGKFSQPTFKGTCDDQ